MTKPSFIYAEIFIDVAIATLVFLFFTCCIHKLKMPSTFVRFLSHINYSIPMEIIMASPYCELGLEIGFLLYMIAVATVVLNRNRFPVYSHTRTASSFFQELSYFTNNQGVLSYWNILLQNRTLWTFL